jgi:hypothetical protein
MTDAALEERAAPEELFDMSVGIDVEDSTPDASSDATEDEDRDIGDAFNWNRDDLAVPEQPAIAVYENARGDIVIRQPNPCCDHDDIILVNRRNVADLILALRIQAGLD